MPPSPEPSCNLSSPPHPTYFLRSWNPRVGYNPLDDPNLNRRVEYHEWAIDRTKNDGWGPVEEEEKPWGSWEN